MNNNPRKKHGSAIRRGAGLALLTAVMAHAASAASYDVKHNFRLRPGGNVVPRVTATHYAHSYIQERRADCEDFAVAPAQGAAFNPYGRDILRDRRGRVRNRGVDGRWRDATNGSVAVGAAGINQRIQAFTFGCRSIADANTSVLVNPLSAGGRVTGTIRAWGEAKAALRPPRRSKAYAFSMTLVEAQGGRAMRNGNIRWGRVVRDLVGGRAGARRQVDPVDYTVTDLVTGEVHTGTLYTATIDILKRGGGGFTWDNDKVDISARDLDFYVEFPTALTSRQGKLDLRVRNGKVTHAEATGQYAGILPPVGSRVPLTFPLADEEEFDYDLGDFDGHDLDVNLEFSGAGETEEARTADPELTVTVPRDDPDAVIQLTFPPQNCPVVLQQSTNMSVWDDTDIVHVLRSSHDGMDVFTVPVVPGRDMFFRLQTREDQVTDTDAPKFLAEAVCGDPLVLINFTEPVDPEFAQDPFLYQIVDQFGGINPVHDAQMLAPDTVMLFLEQPIEPGLQLQAVVRGGIKDLAGNEMRTNYAVPVDCQDGDPDSPVGELPNLRTPR